MKTAKRHNKQLETACKELRAVLLEDLALGRRLLANTQAQQSALIKNDHHRISEVEAEGRDIVALQEANGICRETAIREVAQLCGVEYVEGDPLPRLADLALHLPLPEAKALLALRTSILEAEQAIRAANDRNRTLVQNALDVVHFTFHALTDLAHRPQGYGTSRSRHVSPTFYLDHRA